MDRCSVGYSRCTGSVDGFVGRIDGLIKPFEDIKPEGVTGTTLFGDGSVILVLDAKQLLSEPVRETRQGLFRLAA